MNLVWIQNGKRKKLFSLAEALNDNNKNMCWDYRFWIQTNEHIYEPCRKSTISFAQSTMIVKAASFMYLNVLVCIENIAFITKTTLSFLLKYQNEIATAIFYSK